MYLTCTAHAKRVFISPLSGLVVHALDNTECGTLNVNGRKGETYTVANVIQYLATPRGKEAALVEHQQKGDSNRG